MSPEQARGDATDKRPDIWAFGCVLFEMLTAQRPFQGHTVSDTLARVLEREPDWASAAGGDARHRQAASATLPRKGPGAEAA